MPSRKLSVRQARKALKGDDNQERDAVLSELGALAASEITDVVTWERDGESYAITASSDLTPRAKKAIKKIRITPGQFGSTVEVELHDKLGAARLLARHHGLLDRDSSARAPSVIDVNVTHVGDDDET